MRILVSLLGLFRFLGSLMGANPVDDCSSPKPVGIEFREHETDKRGVMRVIIDCKNGKEVRYEIGSIEKEKNYDWNERWGERKKP